MSNQLENKIQSTVSHEKSHPYSPTGVGLSEEELAGISGGAPAGMVAGYGQALGRLRLKGKKIIHTGKSMIKKMLGR